MNEKHQYALKGDEQKLAQAETERPPAPQAPEEKEDGTEPVTVGDCHLGLNDNELEFDREWRQAPGHDGGAIEDGIVHR